MSVQTFTVAIFRLRNGFMDIQLWLAFVAASLVIALIPGPGVASIVGFAVSSGRKVALASVAGMAIGNAVAVSLSLAGAAAILATSAIAFTALKWAGALYLFVIGLIAVIKSGGSSAEGGAVHYGVSARTAFLANVLVGTFHPKTILFFVAFAAQFIRADAPYLPQALILIVTFTDVAAMTDTLYALGASHAGRVIKSDKAKKWSQRIGGGTIMAAGVATAMMRK